jgi:broad specificity phosphatase PhoE
MARGLDALPLLALLRHGPTQWTEERRLQGRTDLPLSAKGRRAVAGWRLAREVDGFAWLTSPLRRASETAALLGHGDAAVDGRLVEMSWGMWEGCRLVDLRREMGPAFSELEDRGLDFRPAGGESPREVQARLKPLLAEIAQNGHDCLAVTHKAAIRAIYSLASGWPLLGEPPVPLAEFALHIFALAADGTPSVASLNLPLESVA